MGIKNENGGYNVNKGAKEMCVECQNHNFVCNKCGTILDPEWERLLGYWTDRKGLRRLVETSKSDCFVWFLKYNDKIVRVGFGSLQKLFNETKPSPHYIKFDSVFIYMCRDIEERNIFATYAMGNIDSVDNRKAVPNERYIGKMLLRFKSTVPVKVRQYVLDDPDLVIGSAKYWDIRKLRENGYVY